MNRVTKKVVVAVIALTAVSGCADKKFENVNSGMLIGAVGGMVVGGIAGSYLGGGLANNMFIAAGVVTGGIVGASIGRQLGASDRAMHDTTTTRALSSANDGESVAWTNPETGTRGVIRPVRSFTAADGKYCRDFRSTVAREKDFFSGNGIGCQQADGRWMLVADEMG